MLAHRAHGLLERRGARRRLVDGEEANLFHRRGGERRQTMRELEEHDARDGERDGLAGDVLHKHLERTQVRLGKVLGKCRLVLLNLDALVRDRNQLLQLLRDAAHRGWIDGTRARRWSAADRLENANVGNTENTKGRARKLVKRWGDPEYE